MCNGVKLKGCNTVENHEGNYLLHRHDNGLHSTQTESKTILTLFLSHCCSALYNPFWSSSPPAPAIILECAVENEPVFSDTQLVVRDASCWTSLSYKAFFGGGVDGAETQAQITEKKRSLSSWPSRVKTRPGCCTLSRHCLLKCWHLGLNEVFKFSQNILEMLYGKTPSFSCANLTTLHLFSNLVGLIALQGFWSSLEEWCWELLKH